MSGCWWQQGNPCVLQAVARDHMPPRVEIPWLPHLPLLQVLVVGGRSVALGQGWSREAGASSKAQEGNQCTSIISTVGPSFHPAALGMVLLQRPTK